MKGVKKQNFLWLLLFFFICGVGFLMAGLPVRGDDSQEEKIKQLQEQIEEYSRRLEELGKKKASLANEIARMDSQIKLTSLKIQQTQASISLLEEQIKELSGKISELNSSLDTLSLIFLNRVVATYKSRRISPLAILLSSRNFADFYRRWQYFRILQLNDRRVMVSLEETRSSYDKQKKEREEKQEELERLKATLKAQKRSLEEQKESKRRLLEVTKNDEGRYQKLLAQAKAELNALRSFALSRGGGLLPPQPSPDGWYYNQRDQRWGAELIGNSDMPIWEVGCLVTCVAMLFTKNGFPTNPLEIAQNPSYFFSNTAYMLRPWPTPPGYKLVFSSYSNRFNFINQELKAGRPVIVHLNIGGDGHFVVIKRKEGDEYIINDPWYGPDIKLSEYYSTSQIDTAASYQKS
ncbi:C39 family peptidase [bacterium]|nr:C39 family peptidase [bacterium]